MVEQPDAHQLEMAISAVKHSCCLCNRDMTRLGCGPSNVAWLVRNGYMPKNIVLDDIWYGLPAIRLEGTDPYMVCVNCLDLPEATLNMRVKAFAIWLEETRKSIRRKISAQNGADTASHKRMSSAEQASATLSGMLEKRMRLDGR